MSTRIGPVEMCCWGAIKDNLMVAAAEFVKVVGEGLLQRSALSTIQLIGLVMQGRINPGTIMDIDVGAQWSDIDD